MSELMAERSEDSLIAQAMMEQQLRLCSVCSRAGFKARTVVAGIAATTASLSATVSHKRLADIRAGLMSSLADGLVEQVGRWDWSAKFVGSLQSVINMTGMEPAAGTKLFLESLCTRVRLRAAMTTNDFAQGCYRADSNPKSFVRTILALAEDHGHLNATFIVQFRDALLTGLGAAMPRREESAIELQAVLTEALMLAHINQSGQVQVASPAANLAAAAAPRARRASI